MKHFALFTVVILIVLIASAYRYSQVIYYPIGTGESATSPNGQYTASIMSFHDKSFWGHEESWIEFVIYRGAEEDENVVRRKVTEPIEDAHFGSRSNTHVIFWAEDSSEVKFVFPKTTVVLKP